MLYSTFPGLLCNTQFVLLIPFLPTIDLPPVSMSTLPFYFFYFVLWILHISEITLRMSFSYILHLPQYPSCPCPHLKFSLPKPLLRTLLY